MNPDQEQPDPQPTPTPTPTPPLEQLQPTPTPEAASGIGAGPTAFSNPVPPAPAPDPTPASPTPIPTPSPAPVEPDMTIANPFAAPTGPIGSSPVVADTVASTSAGGSKKKLIIILSAVIGGLLILGGIAAAAYFLLFAVGKQDYQQAYDQMNVIRESINESSASTSASDRDTLAEATASYETYKIEHAKLGELKAIRFDAEVNEKYKVYDAKADEFIAFMDEYLPSAAAFIEASESLQSFEMTSASIQGAIDAYETAAGKVTSPIIKTYLDSALATFKKMLPQVKIYENTSNPTSKRLAAANQLSSISRELTNATSKLSKDLSDRTKSISPKDSFNELGVLITKKLNEA